MPSDKKTKRLEETLNLSESGHSRVVVETPKRKLELAKQEKNKQSFEELSLLEAKIKQAEQDNLKRKEAALKRAREDKSQVKGEEKETATGRYYQKNAEEITQKKKVKRVVHNATEFKCVYPGCPRSYLISVTQKNGVKEISTNLAGPGEEVDMCHVPFQKFKIQPKKKATKAKGAKKAVKKPKSAPAKKSNAKGSSKAKAPAKGRGHHVSRKRAEDDEEDQEDIEERGSSPAKRPRSVLDSPAEDPSDPIESASSDHE